MKQIESDVINCYRATGSVKAVARECQVSEYKARKILAAHSELDSDTARTIRALFEAGNTIDDIAAQLGVSRNYVMSFTPYTRPVYKDAPSPMALRIRKCRSKDT